MPLVKAIKGPGGGLYPLPRPITLQRFRRFLHGGRKIPRSSVRR